MNLKLSEKFIFHTHSSLLTIISLQELQEVSPKTPREGDITKPSFGQLFPAEINYFQSKPNLK